MSPKQWGGGRKETSGNARSITTVHHESHNPGLRGEEHRLGAWNTNKYGNCSHFGRKAVVSFTVLFDVVNCANYILHPTVTNY
jgi:hypothetical protein